MEDSPAKALSGCLCRTLVTESDLSSHTENTFLPNLLFTKNNSTKRGAFPAICQHDHFVLTVANIRQLNRKERTIWGTDHLIIKVMVVGSFYNPSKHFQATSEYKTLHLLTTNDNKPVFVQTSGRHFLLSFMIFYI